MKTPLEIKELSWHRLDEAQVLFANGKFDGAFYLAGYAVELMLKFRICEQFDIPNLFDEFDQETNALFGIGEIRKTVKTHNLRVLLAYSGLKKKFDEIMQTDSNFATIYEGLFHKWTEQSRYNTAGTMDRVTTGDILDALGNKSKGVLQWLNAK